MISLHLIHDIHKSRPLVKSNVVHDRGLITFVKQQKGVRWRQYLKTWCVFKKDFIDNSQFRGSLSITHPPEKIQALKPDVQRSLGFMTHGSKKSLANIKNPQEPTPFRVDSANTKCEQIN
ncbi:MAG: hypothetical protein P8H45_01740 [Flavobacteriaceae bacterium]|nr:hypothetical protein [Flavobacteriaceae bacterium]